MFRSVPLRALVCIPCSTQGKALLSHRDPFTVCMCVFHQPSTWKLNHFLFDVSLGNSVHLGKKLIYSPNLVAVEVKTHGSSLAQGLSSFTSSFP